MADTEHIRGEHDPRNTEIAADLVGLFHTIASHNGIVEDEGIHRELDRLEAGRSPYYYDTPENIARMGALALEELPEPEEIPGPPQKLVESHGFASNMHGSALQAMGLRLSTDPEDKLRVLVEDGQKFVSALEQIPRASVSDELRRGLEDWEKQFLDRVAKVEFARHQDDMAVLLGGLPDWTQYTWKDNIEATETEST
jgi:hypothetical protein